MISNDTILLCKKFLVPTMIIAIINGPNQSIPSTYIQMKGWKAFLSRISRTITGLELPFSLLISRNYIARALQLHSSEPPFSSPRFKERVCFFRKPPPNLLSSIFYLLYFSFLMLWQQKLISIIFLHVWQIPHRLLLTDIRQDKETD